MTNMKFRLALFVFLVMGQSLSAIHLPPDEDSSRFNVLFISIDDLNDYIGSYGGHPQALTPNIDRLASGGMKFLNAHCAASLCKPSRTALMSGFRPSTTGVYGNSEEIRQHPVLTWCEMIPQWLSRHGYFTTSRGKIYHRPVDETDTWDEWVPETGNWGKPPEVPEGYNYNMLPADKAGNFDWGPTDVPKEDTPAWLTAKWVESALNREHDRPFLIAAGIFRPHLPWFVPEEYFDRFPADSILLPEIKNDDLEDIHGQDPQSLYNLTLQYGKREEAVRAYLASISAADDAVGVMLDALESSSYARNTVVILWGDHGWHLGEKLRYKKFTLWEESTRMPLIIRVPGMTTPGSSTAVPVNLVDLYPTITELCGVPPNTNNEGVSLVPLLKDPELEWNSISLCTMGEENHTIRTADWRIIQRGGKLQEMYSHADDPLEHFNLYGEPSYNGVQDHLKFRLDSILFRSAENQKPVRPNTIPGVIQAEKFDRGGEGIAYHDNDSVNRGFTGSLVYFRESEGVDLFSCDDHGGGFFAGVVAEGEWLEYTIEDIIPGTYSVVCRIRTFASGGLFSATLNDESLFHAIGRDAGTGTWEDLLIPNVRIGQEGPAVLKIRFGGAMMDLNWLEFVRTGGFVSLPDAPEAGQFEITAGKKFISVKAPPQSPSFRVELIDMAGKLCLSTGYFHSAARIEVPGSLDHGTYLVHITDGSIDHIKKVNLF